MLKSYSVETGYGEYIIISESPEAATKLAKEDLEASNFDDWSGTTVDSLDCQVEELDPDEIMVYDEEEGKDMPLRHYYQYGEGLISCSEW